MKIVYCLLETYTPGGIGRIATLKANNLSNLGWDVYIITTDQNGNQPYYRIDNKVRQIDLNINLLSNLRDNPLKWFLRKFRLSRLHRKRLTNILMEIKADFVISTFSNDANFLYKINDGSKKILECHFNHDYYLILAKVYRYSFLKKCFAYYRTWENEQIVSKYDAFIPLTQEDYILWKKNSNLFVIPNMLSFNNSIRNYDRMKRIIAVGHFNEQKSFERLIRIWSKIHMNYPDWSVHIYGDGPDKNKYKELIDALEIKNSCKIHSTTPDIKDEYNKSSILCMTSTYEGLPMVLLEAMACGLPIISYACKCGPKDIIVEGKNGFCISENNEESFILKLSQVIENDDLRKKMMVYSYDESLKYSEETIMQKWIDLFEKLKENGSNRKS